MEDCTFYQTKAGYMYRDCIYVHGQKNWFLVYRKINNEMGWVCLREEIFSTFWVEDA